MSDIPALPHQLTAFPPEAVLVNPERGEHHLVLHVARTQRLVVIVNDRDRVLRRGHGQALF